MRRWFLRMAPKELIYCLLEANHLLRRYGYYLVWDAEQVVGRSWGRDDPWGDCWWEIKKLNGNQDNDTVMKFIIPRLKVINGVTDVRDFHPNDLK